MAARGIVFWVSATEACRFSRDGVSVFQFQDSAALPPEGDAADRLEN
jgi:hypothetical protein